MYFQISLKMRKFYVFLREPLLSRTWFSWFWTISAGLLIGSVIYLLFDGKSTWGYALCGICMSAATLIPALIKGKSIEITDDIYRRQLLHSLERIEEQLANLGKKPYSENKEKEE